MIKSKSVIGRVNAKNSLRIIKNNATNKINYYEIEKDDI